MNDERVLEIILKARDEASKTLEGVGKQAGGLADFFSKSFKNAAIVSGAALGGLALEAKTAISAFAESERVVTQTEAVLKSTGGVAGVTADQVEYLAGRMERLTGMSDETVQSGENMLLTFTNIGKDVFPEATKTMLDMSVALGQDVKNSAIQLGKALQDPILGVTALRRVGVNFTEEQQNMIKSLVESGKLMEAQKFILKELKTEFGGSAEAAGKTFTGQLNILSNTFGNLQETIGQFLVNGISPIIPKFQEVVDTLRNVVGGEGDLSDITKTLTEQFGSLGHAVGVTIEYFGAHEQATIALAGALGGVLAISLTAATVAMAGFIGVTAPALLIAGALGAAAALIIANWGAIQPVIEQVGLVLGQFFAGVWQGIMDFVTIVAPQFQQTWAIISTVIGAAISFIYGYWSTVWPSMLQIFKGIWETILGTFRTIWGIFQVAFAAGLALVTFQWKDAWELAKKGFMNIFEGLKTFMSGWWNTIAGMFRSGVNNIIGIVNGAINAINSVSGKMGGSMKIPNLPSFDTGGWVPNTGIAMVHAGEFVLSRDMLAGRTPVPSSVNTTSYQQPITIYVDGGNPGDLDMLGYRLAWELRNSR